jgi:flagellar motor component MotA
MPSGFNSAVARLGSLIAVALLGTVLAGTGKAMLTPFAVALVVMAAVAALGGAASWVGLAKR